MAHRFVIRMGQEIQVFDRYEDIPEEFDHVIEFCPEIPPGPHTQAEHEEIESWLPRFEKLMGKEHARSGKKR